MLQTNTILTYKAALACIKVIQVSEASTSILQKMPSERYKDSLPEKNADRNAAFNIAYRALGYIPKVGVTVNMPNQIKLKNFC